MRDTFVVLLCILANDPTLCPRLSGRALLLPSLLGTFRSSREPSSVGREADITVANAGGTTKSAGGRRCRCWRLILTSLGLKKCVSSSSFCEREWRKMRECQGNTANVKARNYSRKHTSVPSFSFSWSSWARKRRSGEADAPSLPAVAENLPHVREPSSAGREADIAVANAGGTTGRTTKSDGGRRCRCSALDSDASPARLQEKKEHYERKPERHAERQSKEL